MKLMTTLDIIAITLLAIHFGVPLAYYYYAKTRWLPRPWNLKLDPNYQPKVTIIIPTYNEANLIQEKLDNIHMQEYPRDKLEIIIIDSASTDGTIQKIQEWIQKHPDEPIKLIQEPERRGKAHALNHALQYATGEIVIITDVDAFWPDKNTLRETVKWLSDPTVGAVSCLKQPTNPGKAGIEQGYRSYYNILRLAESKAWSTPIFHGELAAYKKHLLQEIGGFPTDIGADDSHTASIIAMRGYRAITPEEITCKEITPQKGYHIWRIRRAQHLIQHFWRTLLIKSKIPSHFKSLIYTEAYLHLVNPWMLLVATIPLIASTVKGNLLATTLLSLGVLLLIYKTYRTWITTQIYLIVATIRNTWIKDLAWEKQEKS